MHCQPTQAFTPARNLRVEGVAGLLAADSVGSLVPRTAFEASVHSVFEHACNLQANGLLLTICTADRPRGPTTLRLARGSPGAWAIDLRRHFTAGEALRGTGERVRTRRACLLLGRAHIWRSPSPRGLLDGRAQARNLRRARERLARFRAARVASHAASAAALSEACRRADLDQVRHHAARLIGLGEGLTPSGDDFLMGLLGGLDAMPRPDLRGALADVILANIDRTNVISAGGLRLAVLGHPGEALCTLREALLCQTSDRMLDAALATLLAVGATSGADMAEGLLAAIECASP